jgi:hypothetical protein
MYAKIKIERGEVQSLSPVLINTIWSVLNAAENEKSERERERDRLPGELHTAFEYHRFYCKQHQNDNGHIFSFQEDSTLLTRKPG